VQAIRSQAAAFLKHGKDIMEAFFFRPRPSQLLSGSCWSHVKYGVATHQTARPATWKWLALKRLPYHGAGIYDSELDGWQPGEIKTAEDIGTVALSIEMDGYRLISLRPRPLTA
jgi:hypothetical protein